MPFDNDEEVPKSRYIIGADLEEHSVEALNGFIDDLNKEIERLKAAIAKKSSGRAQAESLFKKS